MLLHLDKIKFKAKPSGPEVGGIKARFTKAESIMDLTVQELAAALASGQTIQPGVTPFSDDSRAKGRKGTVKEDFSEQTLFMVDIDNKNSATPLETPSHAAATLAEHDLRAAFMYPTFGSSPEAPRFRIALVSDTSITDRTERDRIQTGLISLFPQADTDCTNADRIFFGTDKDFITTDLDAVCTKVALLAIASPEESASKRPKFGETIPTGQRHGTLLSFAATVLKKYGVCDRAHDAYLDCVANCDAPKPEEEIDRIWRDACDFYQRNVATSPDYLSPADYAVQKLKEEFDEEPPPAPPFVIKDGKKTVVNPTLLAAYVREHLKYLFVKEATRGEYHKYVYQDGVYELYSDDMFKGAIKAFVTDYNPMLLKMSVIEETFKQLITDLSYIPQTALNADENLINFQNGLLDIQTLTIRPHSPDVFSTIQIPCEWKQDPPPTPCFDAYIKRLVSYNPELETLLLEFIGACLSNAPGYRMKKALFMYGPGDTGKSQLKRLIELLVGDGNYSGIDLQQMEARFGTSSIYGRRLAGSSDMSFLSVDELKIFKKATGGDALFAEFKGQDSFEFVYRGLVWFCMNELPKFGGDDGAWVFERILPVHCPNVVDSESQDHKLLDKMFEEREGIAHKAVMAFREVINRGFRFTEPKQVTEGRKEYRVENNTALEFFHTCMQPRVNRFKRDDPITVSLVYNAYTSWYRMVYGKQYWKTKKEFYKSIAGSLGLTYEELTAENAKGTILRDYCPNPAKWHEYGLGRFDIILENWV